MMKHSHSSLSRPAWLSACSQLLTPVPKLRAVQSRQHSERKSALDGSNSRLSTPRSPLPTFTSPLGSQPDTPPVWVPTAPFTA